MCTSFYGLISMISSAMGNVHRKGDGEQMTDTRPRAEQKAREKHTGSARQQAKEALREEILSLEASGAAECLVTAKGGAVWSAHADGWEALSPSRLDELDRSLLAAVLRSPVLVPSDTGRMVTGGAWLLAAAADEETGALFPPGDVFTLKTPVGIFSGEAGAASSISESSMAERMS